MLIELAHLEFLLTKWTYDRTRDFLETVFRDTIPETKITSDLVILCLTHTRSIGLPPHTPVAQKIADQR